MPVPGFSHLILPTDEIQPDRVAANCRKRLWGMFGTFLAVETSTLGSDARRALGGCCTDGFDALRHIAKPSEMGGVSSGPLCAVVARDQMLLGSDL